VFGFTLTLLVMGGSAVHEYVHMCVCACVCVCIHIAYDVCPLISNARFFVFFSANGRASWLPGAPPMLVMGGSAVHIYICVCVCVCVYKDSICRMSAYCKRPSG